MREIGHSSPAHLYVAKRETLNGFKASVVFDTDEDFLFEGLEDLDEGELEPLREAATIAAQAPIVA